MNSNLTKTLALGLAITGCAFATKADVDYTIGGTADLETFDIDFKGQMDNNVLAGGIQISQPGGGTFNSSMPANYVTVCTDYLGTLYIGSTYQYKTPVANFAGQTGIDPAWTNPALAIQNAASIFYLHGDLGSGGLGTGAGGLTLTQMAAVQLAVWMCLYDTTSTGSVSYGVGKNFFVTGGSDSAAVALAQTWVSTLTGANAPYPGALLIPDPLTSQGNADGQYPQELLIGCVPEPSTVFAGAMLLLPLGGSIARVLRKNKQ